MAGIVGTYELVSSEKYDDFLKAAGVSMIQRSMASRVTPIMSWSHENGKWTQVMKTPLKSWQIVFTEGEEFEEELAGGRKCQQNTEDLIVEMRREFEGDQMITRFKVGDATATRIFRKIA